MKFHKIVSPILFVLLILLVGGFLSKNACGHPDIRVSTPKFGETINSPLIIEGEARGTWYFEADFPIFLLDKNEDQIALAIAFAQDEWMTEDFVPFRAEMEFDVSKAMNGILVFKKDNPSDLLELDDEFKMPVIIRGK